MKKTIFGLMVLMFFGLCFSAFGQNIGDFYFKEENGGITITLYKGTTKNVVIPEKIDGLPVVAIGDYVFENYKLTSITLPNSLTSVGDGAFSKNQLTSITIPNSLSSVGMDAFEGGGNYGFDNFYINQEKRAGTYVYHYGKWQRQ